MSLERKNPRCHGCRGYLIDKLRTTIEENEVKTLKQCSSCHIAQYCSAKCQKNEWKCHKPWCIHIKKLSKEIENMEKGGILAQMKLSFMTKTVGLRRFPFHYALQMEQYLESQQGCVKIYTTKALSFEVTEMKSVFQNKC